MAPFYCLAEMIAQGRTDPADARWIGWCNEWAEWIMSDGGLPKTEEGGFQHGTSETRPVTEPRGIALGQMRRLR